MEPHKGSSLRVPKIVRRTTMGPYVVPTRKRSLATSAGMEEIKKAKCLSSHGTDYAPSWQYSPTDQPTSPVIRRSSLPIPFYAREKQGSCSRKQPPFHPGHSAMKENLRSSITTSSSPRPNGGYVNRVRLTRCSTLPVFNSNANKAAKLGSFCGIAAVVATGPSRKRIAVLVSSNHCSPPVTPFPRASSRREPPPPLVRRLTYTMPTVNRTMSTSIAEDTYDYSMHDFGTQPNEVWSSDSLLTSSNPAEPNSELRSLLASPSDSSAEHCHSGI